MISIPLPNLKEKEQIDKSLTSIKYQSFSTLKQKRNFIARIYFIVINHTVLQYEAVVFFLSSIIYSITGFREVRKCFEITGTFRSPIILSWIYIRC